LNEILRDTEGVLTFWKQKNNKGSVTTSRRDCWTFIIAYQIIFCTNFVYAPDIILFWKYECYHRTFLFGTLVFLEPFVVCNGIACSLRVFNGPLTTRVDTVWLCICINLTIQTNSFILVSFDIKCCNYANLHNFIRYIHTNKSGIFPFSSRYRVCYFNISSNVLQIKRITTAKCIDVDNAVTS
jgi:hypothetical protein